MNNDKISFTVMDAISLEIKYQYDNTINGDNPTIFDFAFSNDSKKTIPNWFCIWWK